MGKKMRLDRWEIRLQNYLDNIGPFEWGKTDCCMFSVGAVEAVTGINHGQSYTYKTESEAKKMLIKTGGVEAVATKHLGEPKPSLLAQRGDIVLLNVGNGDTLGVCIGDKIAAMQADGLTYLPMSNAIKAWSV